MKMKKTCLVLSPVQSEWAFLDPVQILIKAMTIFSDLSILTDNKT